MSDVRRIKRWRTEIGTDDTEYVTLPASDYDALAARLAEVEAAGVRYTTMTDKNLDRLAAKLEAAEARVRELEPDAERYRWLREGDNDETVMMVYESAPRGGVRPFDARFDNSFVLREEKLDAAIDAARAGDSARTALDDLHQMDHEDSKT